MSKPNENQVDPWPLVLLEWTGRTLVVVFSVALLSVVGYAMIGGIVGTVGTRQWVRPSVAELLKTTSLLTLVGGGLGIMTSAYLAIVLISVTTSPFVPHSWRPGTAAYVAEEDDRVGSRRRHESSSGVGAGTSFYHPLLGPIIGYTVVPMLALGFVAGIGFSFFPDASDSA